MKTVYIGNLPYSATEDEIKDLLSPFGDVQAVKLIMDRDTGRPKGFGFAQMDDNGASAAIRALEGQQFGGRRLRVNEARERRQHYGFIPQREPYHQNYSRRNFDRMNS